MKTLKECSIPEFVHTVILVHPSKKFLSIRVSFKNEDNNVELDSEELEELVIERFHTGNLAAWFKAEIEIFVPGEDIPAHTHSVVNCTAESFDNFLEEEFFWEEVEYLIDEMSVLYQSHPLFFDSCLLSNKLVS